MKLIHILAIITVTMLLVGIVIQGVEESKSFATTPLSKCCYSVGNKDSLMKEKNKIYYKTLDECGKPYRD